MANKKLIGFVIVIMVFFAAVSFAEGETCTINGFADTYKDLEDAVSDKPTGIFPPDTQVEPQSSYAITVKNKGSFRMVRKVELYGPPGEWVWVKQWKVNCP